MKHNPIYLKYQKISKDFIQVQFQSLKIKLLKCLIVLLVVWLLLQLDKYQILIIQLMQIVFILLYIPQVVDNYH